MKEINIKRHGETFTILVDDEDYQRCLEYRWNIKKHQKSELVKYYAVHTYKVKGLRGKEGYRRTLRMSHFILGTPPDKMQIDHINANGLDNRKENLRFVTNQQNCWNSQKRTNTSSIYKGVYLCSKTLKWVSYIVVSGKKTYLGAKIFEIDAAFLYDEAALEHFGEYANINITNYSQLINNP